ncbi:hypothetical protein T4D_14141 [Trichinella pseudospiralis]|uniref:Uncharacterized protein n=1 Tax=Trichinella pseudospiralis TaxID=6337 RepID=A0A0V1G6J1_TRIPS|nr:hypothetical protein T4D_14141 [Trichinella pseudospiralis]
MTHLSIPLEEDAAFCFHCRKSSDCGEKKAELSFCTSGYYSWKCALDKSNGFARHEMLTAQACGQLIFDIVKFLASNEHSVRGDDESYSVSSSETCPLFGLFLRMFEFTLVRDTRLQEVIKYSGTRIIPSFLAN